MLVITDLLDSELQNVFFPKVLHGSNTPISVINEIIEWLNPMIKIAYDMREGQDGNWRVKQILEFVYNSNQMLMNNETYLNAQNITDPDFVDLPLDWKQEMLNPPFNDPKNRVFNFANTYGINNDAGLISKKTLAST